MTDPPPGAWIRATYQPRDTSALTEHQRERVGVRALFRPNRGRPTLDTPAKWKSFSTVDAADLAEPEGVSEAEGLAEWRADLLGSAEAKPGSWPRGSAPSGIPPHA